MLWAGSPAVEDSMFSFDPVLGNSHPTDHHWRVHWSRVQTWVMKMARSWSLSCCSCKQRRLVSWVRLLLEHCSLHRFSHIFKGQCFLLTLSHFELLTPELLSLKVLFPSHNEYYWLFPPVSTHQQTIQCWASSFFMSLSPWLGHSHAIIVPKVNHFSNVLVIRIPSVLIQLRGVHNFQWSMNKRCFAICQQL